MEPAVWSVVVAVGALGVACWSVVVAHRANGRSKEANAIAERALPAAWSEMQQRGENLIGFRNQSSRHIVVEAVSVEPDKAKGAVRLKVKLPTRVEYGDVFPLTLNRMLAGNAKKVILRWRFEDSGETQSSERLV